MHTQIMRIVATFLVASPGFGQVVSVNFEGLDSNAASNNRLDPADVGGLVPVAGWNNLPER